MTREEAISIMNVIVHMLEDKYDTDRVEEAVDMAIKALEQEPCEDATLKDIFCMGCEYREQQPKTDGDCISRQAVLDGLASIAKAKAKSDQQKSLMGRTMFFVEQLPSVTPAPKMGHWILTLEDWKKWECSECGYTKRTDIHVSLGYNYCPKCGAKMEDEK